MNPTDRGYETVILAKGYNRYATMLLNRAMLYLDTYAINGEGKIIRSGTWSTLENSEAFMFENIEIVYSRVPFAAVYIIDLFNTVYQGQTAMYYQEAIVNEMNVYSKIIYMQ